MSLEHSISQPASEVPFLPLQRRKTGAMPGSSPSIRTVGNQSDPDESSERSAKRPEACGETVLVVDDIDGVRDLIREVLEMDGYEVLQAEHGQEALQVARQHTGPIHLLLTDVVMPGMGGMDLADRMLQERPEVRVVFMSGYSDEAISRHGVLQPGAAFLKKPFTSDSLTRCIRQELDKA